MKQTPETSANGAVPDTNQRPRNSFYIVSVSQGFGKSFKAGFWECLVLARIGECEYEVIVKGWGLPERRQTGCRFDPRDVKGYLFRAQDLVSREIVTPQKRMKIEFFHSGDMDDFIQDVMEIARAGQAEPIAAGEERAGKTIAEAAA